MLIMLVSCATVAPLNVLTWMLPVESIRRLATFLRLESQIISLLQEKGKRRAGVESRQGRQRAGVESGQGRQRAGVESRQGRQRAGVESRQGRQRAGVESRQAGCCGWQVQDPPCDLCQEEVSVRDGTWWKVVVCAEWRG